MNPVAGARVSSPAASLETNGLREIPDRHVASPLAAGEDIRAPQPCLLSE